MMAWQIIRTVWRVLLSAAYVLAVLAIFEKVSTRDTEIILAAIGLTYVAVRHGTVGQHLAQVNIAKALDVEFATLRRMIDPSYAHPDQTALEKQVFWNLMRAGIEGVGLTIIAIICIYQLLS